MSKNQAPSPEPNEPIGVITLQKYGELLIANFVPPLPKGVPTRNTHDTHVPNSPIERDENGGIAKLTYGRDTFGWSKSEREKDFAKYFKRQAKRVGYELASKTIEKIEAPVKHKTISSVARRAK